MSEQVKAITDELINKAPTGIFVITWNNGQGPGPYVVEADNLGAAVSAFLTWYFQGVGSLPFQLSIQAVTRATWADAAQMKNLPPIQNSGGN